MELKRTILKWILFENMPPQAVMRDAEKAWSIKCALVPEQ
jgi:hypothetical protein